MKKLKYLITIIVICIIVFIGIEVFRKVEHEEENTIISNTTENTSIENTNTIQEQNNAISNSNISKLEEIKSGKELMEKAEKTLTARGWAGASNNVVGLKDQIIYYYNKETGEFYKIASGIEDIYYETEFSEEIIVKQSVNVEKFSEIPNFLVFK